MNSSARPHSNVQSELPQLPLRKESYTTWLYVGLALASVVTLVLGFWLAGSSVP